MDTTPIEQTRGPGRARGGSGEPAPMMDWIPLLLQTGDALFPTGAYAHSLGFEECVRLGLVRDERSLREFLLERALPMLASFELPYLRLARDAALTDDFKLLAGLDAEVGAAKLARETREASVQLGVRRLKALRVILPGDGYLSACEQSVNAGKMAGHHVIVCGVQAAASGIPLEAALGAYLYHSLAAVGGASLKLIRIGQEGVQRAVRAAVSAGPAAVVNSLTVPRENAGWLDPLLEIASMRHEHAGERLFIS